MLLSKALLSAQASRSLVALGARAASTTATNNSAAGGSTPPPGNRIVRQEPGKVRMGFIPEEWFTLFYKKTGVTGPYTFGFTLTTYLLSKEIIVMEHEYYSTLSLVIMIIFGVKKLGPAIAKALDKEIDNYEQEWNQSRVHEKQLLESQIKDEEKLQWSSEGQNLVVQAKRENVQLQLEAAYRARMMAAYEEVKKRLDYQVEKQSVETRLSQKNLVDYVVTKVRSSITPDQDKQNIDKCIADLSAMAKA